MLLPLGSITQLKQSQGCFSRKKVLLELGTDVYERLLHLVVQPPPEEAGRC